MEEIELILAGGGGDDEGCGCNRNPFKDDDLELQSAIRLGELDECC